MTPRSHFCLSTLAMGFSAALIAAQPATAAPSAQTAAAGGASRSVFVIPKNPNDGRDPFFPTSSRPYESTQVVQQTHFADITSLVLKGVSGPTDRRLAIINNRTLAIGDEQDITTSQGRIHVRCVEIKTDSVVVEIAGEMHELKYAANH
jgi:hypothetical protein